MRQRHPEKRDRGKARLVPPASSRSRTRSPTGPRASVHVPAVTLWFQCFPFSAADKAALDPRVESPERGDHSKGSFASYRSRMVSETRRDRVRRSGGVRRRGRRRPSLLAGRRRELITDTVRTSGAARVAAGCALGETGSRTGPTTGMASTGASTTSGRAARSTVSPFAGATGGRSSAQHRAVHDGARPLPAARVSVRCHSRSSTRLRRRPRPPATSAENIAGSEACPFSIRT